ncbi:MAG: type II secretion system protein [Planctomycetes bacterium]|nr:type II secretion system protein [Planctomycetota bacterium]
MSASSGFTLLEVLLATVIFGLAVAVLGISTTGALRQVSEARLMNEATLTMQDRLGILERDGLPQEEGSTSWEAVEPPETPRLLISGTPTPVEGLFWRRVVTAATLPDPQTQEDSETFMEMVVEVGIARADRGGDVRPLLSLTARYPKAQEGGE